MLPLKQYEVTLQNAQRVLEALLGRPAKPELPLAELIDGLGKSCSALRQRTAACRVQQAFRRHRAKRSVAKTSTRVKELRAATTPQGVVAATPVVAAAPVTRRESPAPRVEHSLERPPVPPKPLLSEVGHTLNPLEKRRQLVAAQLASANPSRLPRCRRTMLAAAPTAPTVRAPATPRSGAQATPLSGELGDRLPSPRVLAPLERAHRAPDVDESSEQDFSGVSPRHQQARLGFDAASSLPGERHPPPLAPVAPLPGAPLGRRPPCDLLLKEDVIDFDPSDPECRRVTGMMAPPQAGGALSAGISLPPPGGMTPRRPVGHRARSRGSSPALPDCRSSSPAAREGTTKCYAQHPFTTSSASTVLPAGDDASGATRSSTTTPGPGTPRTLRAGDLGRQIRCA